MTDKLKNTIARKYFNIIPIPMILTAINYPESYPHFEIQV